jgi:hypothetical protein
VIVAVLRTVGGRRRTRGGDGAGGRAADRAKAVGLRKFGDGAGLDDAAGDPATHHQIALELLNHHNLNVQKVATIAVSAKQKSR